MNQLSVLNDGIFLNHPSWWWVILKSLPTLFILSYSNKISQLSPRLHFNRYCMSASATQAGLTGVDEHAAQWITMSRNDALKKNTKREGGCHALWPSFSLFHTSLSSPSFPAFMLIVSAGREHRGWHTVKNQWHNFSQIQSLTLVTSICIVIRVHQQQKKKSYRMERVQSWPGLCWQPSHNCRHRRPHTAEKIVQNTQRALWPIWITPPTHLIHFLIKHEKHWERGRKGDRKEERFIVLKGCSAILV